MSDTVISAENIGKSYLVGHKSNERYVALRDVIANAVKGLISKGPDSSKEIEEFWALKDISFDVSRGDCVGIIGRNGAGKSTLLKILSRITEPTKGKISIRGRVASLLEVGTGFHPELTGRENIYLNGAILGMSRQEIKRKFDEIVAFSEVKKFLDTPVKHFSSGMYMRLAFAVAAHLEPEILVVDEVLAVGDASFQKKCLGKMSEVTKEGRTVLFVSHNMHAVEQLCDKCIMLDRGNLKIYSKDVRAVIKQYLFEEGQVQKTSAWKNNGKQFDNPWFKPSRFAITDEQGKDLVMPLSNDVDFFVTVEGDVTELDNALSFGYTIYSEDGTSLYWTSTTDEPENQWPKMKKGHCVLKSRIPRRFLNEGTFRLEFLSSLYHRQWLCQPGVNAPVIFLTVQGGLSDSPYWMGKRSGYFAPVMKWTIAK